MTAQRFSRCGWAYRGGRPSKPESGNGLVSGLLVSEDALDDFGVLS